MTNIKFCHLYQPTLPPLSILKKNLPCNDNTAECYRFFIVTPIPDASINRKTLSNSGFCVIAST